MGPIETAREEGWPARQRTQRPSVRPGQLAGVNPAAVTPVLRNVQSQRERAGFGCIRNYQTAAGSIMTWHCEPFANIK